MTGEQLEFGLICATDAPQRVVLDADFRAPGHPLPGLPLPAESRVDDEPTDPATLAAVAALIAEFAERRAAIMGTAPEFAPGRSEAEILAAERIVGARLPEDLRALYRTIDGEPRETGLLGRYGILPLDQLVEWHTGGLPGSPAWPQDDVFGADVVIHADPKHRVRRVARHDWWITVGTDQALNYLAVDLDPDDAGRVGQIIEYGRDLHCAMRYVESSVGEMLRQVVTGLRAGDYEVEGGHLTVTTLFDTGDTGADCGLVLNQADDLAAAVAGHDAVQRLNVNRSETVDLAALSLRSLRDLAVNRAGTVTTEGTDLPALESLRITADSVDLTGLTGHPLLWRLHIAGAVDLDPLTTLPALCDLDISGCDTLDVGRLAALPSLRVLTMNAAQWRALGSPPPLAAAGKTGPGEWAFRPE
ncbi:SMI1/KNR4 family protein [Actinokineospora sp. HUAS TT18]|uniref:SMI1/KNR4 family protein n=1 Tax=Actinokineospora sp. HUAS TT18 TaxID=3447451 RepID=UPI003F51BD3F